MTAGTAARATADARARLGAAQLYLCTDARTRQGDLPEFLDAVLAAGVDIVQLREKGMEAREELAHLEVFADACRRRRPAARRQRPRRRGARRRRRRAAPGPGRPARARRPRHPGRRARERADRPLHPRRGGDPRRGRGARRRLLLHRPVLAHPHQGRAPRGLLGLVRYAAGLGTDRPWFAIGGIDLGNLDEVLAAGARRVVVVRALTATEDPGAATGEFVRRLCAARNGDVR